MSALTDVFTAIANAIRGKNGLTTTYTPSQMAQAITDIPSGSSLDAVGYMAGGGTLIKSTADGTKVLIFPNPNPTGMGTHTLVYNGESNRDEFLIGFNGSSALYPIYRIKADDTLEGISISSISNLGCGRLRKLDMGSYTSYPKFYFFPNGATSAQNKIAESVDGASWTVESISLSDSYIYTDIAFSPLSNSYVAVSSNYSNGRVIYRRGNSSTWSIITLGIQFSTYSVAYGHGRFVIVGGGGTIMYSSSGTSSIPSSWANVNNSGFSSVSFNMVEWIEELSAFVCLTSSSTIVFLPVTSSGSVGTRVVLTVTGLSNAFGAVYNPRTEKLEILGTATVSMVKTSIVEITGALSNLQYTIKPLCSSGVLNNIAYKPVS